ncbi:MAG: NAD-dependent epimerase/dehydratase family protein [Deltaproteobacteria bacterium]|nr:MAG: NAD-dependent epimerase/dehydratase family protein [Deltaproteobacteria bacterium]
MARVLVTGATGFIGRHLVRRLREEGHAVTALCRREDPALRAEGVTIEIGDILVPESVEGAARGREVLFHLAGRVSRDPHDAEAMMRLHVEGTEQTLRAAHAAGVRRVVHMSTSGTVAVSEDPNKIATEEDPPPIGIIGRWPYYRSKLFAEERACELGTTLPGLEVVVLNPTLVLGPGDERGSSTGDVRRFLAGRVPAVPRGGLSFVDVRDVAEAALLAMEKGVGGRRYLLGACNLTLQEFFARLARIAGLTPPIELPRPAALTDLSIALLDRASRLVEGEEAPERASIEMAHYYWYLDPSRAKRELGWVPRDPLDTLSDTVHDLYERGAVERRLPGLAARLEETGRTVLSRFFDRIRTP